MAHSLMQPTLSDMLAETLRPETTRIARQWIADYAAQLAALVPSDVDGEGEAMAREGLALVLGERIAEALAPVIARASALPQLVAAVEQSEARAEQTVFEALERERALVRKLVGVVTDLQRVEQEGRKALSEFRAIYEPRGFIARELSRSADIETLPGARGGATLCAAGCGEPRRVHRATCGSQECSQKYVDAIETRPRNRE